MKRAKKQMKGLAEVSLGGAAAGLAVGAAGGSGAGIAGATRYLPATGRVVGMAMPIRLLDRLSKKKRR